jgi:ankyrin repeat protein
MGMIAWLGEKAGLGILRERMKDVEHLKRYRELPDLLQRLAIAGSVHRDAQHLEIFRVIPSDYGMSFIFGDTLLMMAVALQSEEFVKYLVNSDVYVDEQDQNNTDAFDRLTSQPEVDWDKALRILRILSKSLLLRYLNNYDEDDEDEDEDDDMSDWDWEKHLRRKVSKWEEGVRQHRRSWRMTTHRDLQESKRQLRETTHNKVQVAVSTNIHNVTSLARQLHHNFDRNVLHQLQVISNITRYDIIVTVSVLVHALLTDEQFHNDEPATYRNYDGPADEAFAVIMNLLMYESLKDDWEGLHQDILTLLPDATREEREMRDNTIMGMIAWLGEKAGLGILRERMQDVEHLKRYRELPDLLQRLAIAGSVHRDAQHLEIFRVIPAGVWCDDVSSIFGDTILMMAVAFQSEEFVEYLVKSDVYVDEQDQNNADAFDRLTSQPEVDWDKALRILRILSRSLLRRSHHVFDDEDEDDDMSESEEWVTHLRRMVSKWEEGVRQHRRSWRDID